jgi:folate-binding protein YgfZ
LHYAEPAGRAVIGIEGPDAQGFLHGQLTCDLNALAPDHSTYGAYCTPKGRVLATFLLWRTDTGYFMQLPAALRDAIQKRLSMYVLRAKVKVFDAGSRWIMAGISGKEARSRIEGVLGVAPRNEHELAHALNAMAIRLPLERYAVFVPPDDAAGLLAKLGQDAEAAGPGYWDWLDIRAGVPTVTPATQEEFVPQMVNLDLIGGLSFSKGCYPGQEIVARMHFLGRLKARMYLAHLAVPPGADAPRAGDKLYSSDLGTQSGGMIVNAAPAPAGGFDVLAVIQISSAQGSTVRWKLPDGVALELLPLPYEVSGTA